MSKSRFDSDEMPTLRGESPGDARIDATLLAGVQRDLGSGPAPIRLAGVSLEPGASDARYEATRVLGVGGMGEVRLCHDRRLGRDVALKVMRPEVAADASASARFLREARIQGQLEHPSVVPVYDLDVQADGGVFFTMKRLRGMTLEEVIEGLRRNDPEMRAKHTQRRLLSAFSNVCLAIDFAHARGVIHRDLKPANVMLGEFGEVNVLDWGLAKIVGQDAETGERLIDASAIDGPIGATVHGSLLGTPGYMSPEQARGEVDKLDVRTDVYALGAILFELLTLERMNDGTTTMQLLAQTLSGGGPRRLQAGAQAMLPPELEQLYLRATELEASERLGSARALSDAIERFLDGDRDQTRRREMAAEHAARAVEESAKVDLAGALGREARALALGEVGRALALDPTNKGALRTLATLLTTPPRETPPEAEAEIAAAQATSAKSASKLAALRLTVVSVAGLASLALGLRTAWPALVTLTLYAAAIALALFASKRERPPRRLAFAFLVLASLGTAFLSSSFGEFILVPGVAATNTMFFTLNASRRQRRVVTLFGVATILAPFIAGKLGWVPEAYTAVADGILLHARAIEFGSAAIWVLLALNCLLVASPAFVASRFRDALNAAERKMLLQAWQLKQLVPTDEPAVSRRAETDRAPRSLRV